MQAEPLIGRGRERAVFDKAYERAGGALMLVYGRRRIGKSFLLERLTEGRPTVFYQAAQQSTHEELAAFTRVIASVIGGEYLPAGFVFPSWEAALDFIDQRNTHPRLVVVLDEFPYLADTDPGLPSVIQRWWDKRGRTSRVMLVLCGSAQTFMEGLESSAAPLHGRFTERLRVGPISFRDAATFHASLEHADHVRIYSILGGTPIYLRRWRAEYTVRDNITALFGDPSSGLTDSVELALTTDLPDGRGTFRVLQSVGLGKTSYNDIMQAAKTYDRAIPRLLDLGLLAKRFPITDDPQRSRRSVYAIGDPHFAFYFRFVAPNRSRIDRGFGAQVVDEIIVPRLNAHIGAVFEEMAREYARTAILHGELSGVDVGSWWSTDGKSEIDVVGVDAGRRPTFVGTVKWRDTPLGGDTLNDLNGGAAALGADESVPRLLIGRHGAAAALTRIAHVRSRGLGELYGKRAD